MPAEGIRSRLESPQVRTWLCIGFGVVLAALVYLLPVVWHLDLTYLLRWPNFVEGTIGQSLFTGKYHKVIETPRPLLDVLWALNKKPAAVYPAISILFGLLALILALISNQVFKSPWPGLLTGFIFPFSSGFLEILTNGSWGLPYLVLIMSAVYCYLKQRTLPFAILLFLSGLIRPESWALALFILAVRIGRKRFEWSLLIPILAPIVWAFYDWRISGNPLYSYKITAQYAFYTSLQPTSLLAFWPLVIRGFAGLVGIPILVLGVAGMIRRSWKRDWWKLLDDPIIIFALVPLLFSWASILKAKILFMPRFFPTSVCLLVLAAFFIPYVQFGPKHRAGFIASLALVLALAGIRVSRTLAEAHAGMENQVRGERIMSELVDSLKQIDPAPYRHIFISLRRYADVYQLLGEKYHDKCLSYREIFMTVPTAKDFAKMLPSLGVWMTGFDEVNCAAWLGYTLDRGRSTSHPFTDEGVQLDIKLLCKTQESNGFIYEFTSRQ